MSARAFWLNFDADEELARPEGPRKVPQSPALRGRLLRARALLVPRGDCVVEPRTSEADAAELARTVRRVHCWMPTRRALAELKRLGLPRPPAPSLEVLRAANSRRTSAELGLGVRGARWLTDPDSLRRALATEPGAWLLRRAHGFAGRGRLWLEQDAMEPAAHAYVEQALRRDGGFELAPRVEVRAEFSLHGHLTRGGAQTFGEPLRSLADAHGQWLRARPLQPDELSQAEHRALHHAAARAAERLHALGYFGPFGIDALRYVDRHGEGFAPLVEINARYSMSWGRGMRHHRVDLLEDDATTPR